MLRDVETISYSSNIWHNYNVQSTQGDPVVPAPRIFLHSGSAKRGAFAITTVLLVEDNDMNRDMITRRLTHQGYDVFAVGNAEEGLQSIRDRNPDLVLMDLSLPDRDGWAVTEEIKKDSKTDSIPIIAITAHATKQERDRALEAGCEAYESKPIDFDRLLEKMESFLNGESH